MSHVDHPLFHPANATASDELSTVLATKVRRISGKWFVPFLVGDGHRLPKKTDLPWSAEEERVIFLQWNYYRFKEDERQRALYEQIAEANLGLVCSMVSKHGAAVDGDRDEVISQAQAALLRAIDKFDILLGWKFSTYACAAIHRGLRRLYKQSSRYQQRFGLQYDEKHEKPRRQEESWAEEESHLSLSLGKADLTQQEVLVLELRFFADPPLTLTDTGLHIQKRDGSIGITKEMVRQIQESALKKIRECYEEGLTPRRK